MGSGHSDRRGASKEQRNENYQKDSSGVKKNENNPETQLGKNKPEDMKQTNTPGDSTVLEEYSMKRTPGGYCLIINNVNFKNRKDYRDGSNKDRDELKNVFKNLLKFDVDVKEDLTDEQIDKLLKDIAKKDHNQYDCFVCFILSHGKEEQVCGVNGQHISVSQITSHFLASECKSLYGKPKLFFIQTCQGLVDMKGTSMERDSSFDDMKTGLKKEKIPNEADFLIGFATAAGYVSYRRKEGSLYIQSLCHVFKTHALTDRWEIMKMMTKVNSDVSKMDIDMDYKQMPSVVTRLRKQLYFVPNSAPVGYPLPFPPHTWKHTSIFPE